MAETNAITHPSKSTSLKSKNTSPNPFSNFIYKVIFVFVFVALLPIFPSSQSLEISDNSFLARSWELLRLLLVGIAISYGLFSRKNSDHEIEKETQLKIDVPQSYISQILQVSSVFDDDEDIKSPKGLDFSNETKNQNSKYSQYYREEPVVMVAKENSDDINSNAKPLLLPVRSLKSFDYDNTGKNGGKESTVLPSPIPWRSRSGKMELKEESSSPSPRYSPPSSEFDNELGYSRATSFQETRRKINDEVGLSRPPSFQETRRKINESMRNSKTSSFQETKGSINEQIGNLKTPSFRSINPSLSQEIRGKTSEDLGRKRSFHKSSIPPPPPPPPLPHNYSSHFLSEKKYGRTSFKDELENLRRIQRDEVGSNSFNSEKNSYCVRSFRTVRSKEEQNLPPLPRNKSEKKDEFREKMIIDSESESDRDDGELSDVEEETTSTPKEENQEENEVDKKADEFIAKFREQIRLQRIASIKKSSGQRSTRNSK